jgi:hypothetical protein
MYHNVRVEVFDNEVADVFDSSIATGFIQRQDFSRRVIRRRTVKGRKQGWIPEVYIVCIARKRFVRPFW